MEGKRPVPNRKLEKRRQEYRGGTWPKNADRPKVSVEYSYPNCTMVTLEYLRHSNNPEILPEGVNFKLEGKNTFSDSEWMVSTDTTFDQVNLIEDNWLNSSTITKTKMKTFIRQTIVTRLSYYSKTR